MNQQTDCYKKTAELLRKEKFAVLATALNNIPHASIVAFAASDFGKVILFVTPRKTRKFENICSNPNVSLVIDSRPENSAFINKTLALTILGIASEVKKREYVKKASVFIKKHHSLEKYIDDPYYAFVSIRIKKYVFVDDISKVSVFSPKKLSSY